MKRKYLVIIFILLLSLMLQSCTTSSKQVVIYTSVDQVFSEPILKEFEKETGIKVLSVYDVEAAKTTGLVNRLIAEKDNPQADVFWNGEFAQTIILKRNDVLETYHSSSASDIPKGYLDTEGYWVGFGGRARVLLVNKGFLNSSEYPTSIFDLLDSNVPSNKIGIAYPVFGTTATHVAALYAELGPEKGRDFFEKLQAKEIQVLDGNSVVRDQVVSGKLIMGLTDTDDASTAIKKGEPVEMVFLDQEINGLGTLVIPNTVSLIKNGPNQEEAKIFIDYLLKKETEQKLLELGWINFIVRPASKEIDTPNIKGMNVTFEQIFDHIEKAKKEMAEIFIK